MKRLLRFVAVVLLLAMSAVAPARAAPPDPVDAAQVAPGRILVRFKASTSDTAIQGRIRAQGATEVEQVRRVRLRVLRVPAGREREVARRLAQDPQVEFAHPDYVVRLQAVPNDEFYQSRQWNMKIAGFEGAWDVTTGSSSVVVAVVDTGVQSDHPDLAGRILPGKNLVSSSTSCPTGQSESDTSDPHGHGTHVTGVVAAAGNNGIGVAGVAWQTKILPVRILDCVGSGTVSQLVAGIDYAMSQGARILNISAGTTEDPRALKSIIDDAQARGVLVVAAAGNEGASANRASFPAAYPYVFAVGATNQNDTRSSFSNTGSYVDIVAPGGDGSNRIYSTYPVGLGPGAGYTYFAGTSQATPHVSGLAALLLSISPNLTPQQIMDVIQSTAKDLGPTGKDDQYGYGRIDAAAAVQSVRPTLQASPASFEFIADPVWVNATGSLQISLSSGAPGSFTASASEPWLRVDGSASVMLVTPATVLVTVDRNRVPPGTTSIAMVTVSTTQVGVRNPILVVPVTVRHFTSTLSHAYLPAVLVDVKGGW